MRIYDIIEKKRDGKELNLEEISFFITGYCEGKVPDYQAAALLMAIFIKGMNDRETAELTDVMANSGDRIDLSEIPGIKVDKHSTGGVGDKTTLILGPIVAACGVPVAKMSGRGLGHTGGTIDKLESIPGFRTALTRQEFIDNVREIGIAIAGQTGNLAPADKKLYALRDVTATVNNISLIASSIMSKKLASGADRIVLDVKTGSGAFMKNLDESIALAKAMVEIGNRMGRQTAAMVTDMDVPLGSAVGNSLEVIEAIKTLKGEGPSDLQEVCLEIASRMLELAGIGGTRQCRSEVEKVLESGAALEKLRQLIEKQGGNPAVIDNNSLFGEAAVRCDFLSEADGYVQTIRTDAVGAASMMLGAGRETKESQIDYSAGILLHKKSGMRVQRGEAVATLFTSDTNRTAEALKVLRNAYEIANEPPASRPLILAHVDKGGIRRFD
jgi:pyrimidine-nucleoside phosphorylase